MTCDYCFRQLDPHGYYKIHGREYCDAACAKRAQIVLAPPEDHEEPGPDQLRLA